jgi:hypothetical protein
LISPHLLHHFNENKNNPPYSTHSQANASECAVKEDYTNKKRKGEYIK